MQRISFANDTVNPDLLNPYLVNLCLSLSIKECTDLQLVRNLGKLASCQVLLKVPCLLCLLVAWEYCIPERDLSNVWLHAFLSGSTMKALEASVSVSSLRPHNFSTTANQISLQDFWKLHVSRKEWEIYASRKDPSEHWSFIPSQQ